MKLVIEELRVMTDTGISVYMGSFNRDTLRFVEGRTGVDYLFAGFISAILSVSREISAESVQEISFQRNRMVLYVIEDLIFVATVKEKVPIDDVNTVLKSISPKIADVLEGEYMAMSESQYDAITSILQNTFIKKFWWAKPKISRPNIFKFYSSALTNPDKTYYFTYLPRIYLLFGFLPVLIPIFLAQLVGTDFAALATKPSFSPVLSKNIISLVLIWLGPAIVMKLSDRHKFELSAYLSLSGIYTIYLSFMIFFGSFYYRYLTIGPIISELDLESTGPIFLFLFIRIPVNLAFFGYITIVGYGTLFASSFSNNRHISIYTISTIIMIFAIELVAFFF